MPTPKIHPALRVVFKGDRVIVWTPRQAQPSSLTAQDLERLHGLFTDQAQPPLTQAETRALLAAGFLAAPADGSAMVEPVDAIELPVADELPADLPPRVRRVNHFCLQPGAAGWVAWSPV